MPKHAHGTTNLDLQTSSTRIILDAVTALYDRIINPALTVRRVTVSANRLIPEEQAQKAKAETFEQLDLFTDYEALERERQAQEAQLAKERKLQEALLSVKKKYGKNAILKGMNLLDGATAKDRNRQIGGHKA